MHFLRVLDVLSSRNGQLSRSGTIIFNFYCLGMHESKITFVCSCTYICNWNNSTKDSRHIKPTTTNSFRVYRSFTRFFKKHFDYFNTLHLDRENKRCTYLYLRAHSDLPDFYVKIKLGQSRKFGDKTRLDFRLSLRK